MTKAKLTIEMVPWNCHGRNIRRYATALEWRRICQTILIVADERCQICGSNGKLDCHECWHYDDSTHVQKLIDIQALCKDCHGIKHIGFTISKGRMSNEGVAAHLGKINQWDRSQSEDYTQREYTKVRERSKHKWGWNIDFVLKYGFNREWVDACYAQECDKKIGQLAATFVNSNGHNIRETSIAAYCAIMENGLLSPMRERAYDVLFRYIMAYEDTPTIGELAESFPKSRTSRSGYGNIHTRFGELRGRGVVEELGKRVCKVSGMVVIYWGITGQLPTEPPEPTESTKDKPSYKQLEKRIDVLESENIQLQGGGVPPFRPPSRLKHSSSSRRKRSPPLPMSKLFDDPL